MHVWKPIVALSVATCLACGAARADSTGVIRVGITIVHGCTADTAPVPDRNRPMQVDCTGGVPYRVTTTDPDAHAAHRTAIVPDERTGARIATLTF